MELENGLKELQSLLKNIEYSEKKRTQLTEKEMKFLTIKESLLIREAKIIALLENLRCEVQLSLPDCQTDLEEKELVYELMFVYPYTLGKEMF